MRRTYEPLYVSLYPAMIEKKHAEKLKFSCAAMHNDGVHVFSGDRPNMCKFLKSAKSGPTT
jgi:hypothetical protein